MVYILTEVSNFRSSLFRISSHKNVIENKRFLYGSNMRKLPPCSLRELPPARAAPLEAARARQVEMALDGKKKWRYGYRPSYD